MSPGLQDFTDPDSTLTVLGAAYYLLRFNIKIVLMFAAQQQITMTSISVKQIIDLHGDDCLHNVEPTSWKNMGLFPQGNFRRPKKVNKHPYILDECTNGF